jgi:hypothetical protein
MFQIIDGYVRSPWVGQTSLILDVISLTAQLARDSMASHVIPASDYQAVCVGD